MTHIFFVAFFKKRIRYVLYHKANIRSILSYFLPIPQLLLFTFVNLLTPTIAHHRHRRHRTTAKRLLMTPLDARVTSPPALSPVSLCLPFPAALCFLNYATSVLYSLSPSPTSLPPTNSPHYFSKLSLRTFF